MLYIGTRPTIGEKLERTIEANLFDFDGDLYGEQIRIYFVASLRKDEKFDSVFCNKIN